MKKIAFLFMGFLLTNLIFSQTTVHKLIDPIAIDGNPDESFWNLNLELSNNPGGSDNSATFGLLWNDTHLYIAVDVVDADICNNRRQAFYDDGIEICIDGNHDQTIGFDDNDLQLNKAVRTFLLQEMNMHFEGIIQAYNETDNGYSMEFAIPWETINTPASSGKEIGFNIVVNDDDDQQNLYNLPAQLIWTGNSEYYESPQGWGTVVLSDEQAGFSAPFIALTNPNKSEMLIEGKTQTISWISHDIANIAIAYSTDDGNSWTTIEDNLVAAEGSYDWTVPSELSEHVLLKVSDATNDALEDVSSENSIITTAWQNSENLIKAEWENYRWPYNAYYPDEQGGSGQVGNGCGPSSLARIIHSWKFPRKGNDENSFTDYAGYYWSADFENTIYNYDNMPNFLSQNASEEEYTDVATLFLHAQVAMDDYYGTGTDLANMGFALSHYFNYKESDIAYRHDYTKAEWIQLLKNEIDNGRSLLVQAMTREYYGNWHTSNGIAGHWYHCDGYNDEGEFHIVVGFGNYQYDGYYDVDEFALYSYNVGVLVGLEPDKNGKELTLTYPAGGEVFVTESDLMITWESNGVSELLIEYSSDDGMTWNVIADGVNSAEESYYWTTPFESSDDFYIRITDVENINVYDKNKETFSVQSNQLTLSSPNGGESYVPGEKALISWGNTPVSQLNIYYSTNDGNSWNVIAENVSSSSSEQEWTIPSSISNEVRIKIADESDESNYTVSAETLSITEKNPVGGPYATDEHTMLLIHGEGGLYEQSFAATSASINGDISFESSAVDVLGKAIYLGNDGGQSHITIPHNHNLNLTGSFTIEMWFKPTSFNGDLNYLIWKPGDDDDYFANYALQTNAYWDNELFCYYFSDDDRIGITQQFFPELNEWYHVAFIRDMEEGVLKTLLRNTNREIIDEATMNLGNDTPTPSSKDLIIGSNFSGFLDEIRISNIARTYETNSIYAPEEEVDFAILPNPAYDEIRIKSNSRGIINIYSIEGELVFTKNTSENNRLDLSGLKKGIYLVTFENKSSQTVRKLILR